MKLISKTCKRCWNQQPIEMFEYGGIQCKDCVQNHYEDLKAAEKGVIVYFRWGWMNTFEKNPDHTMMPGSLYHIRNRLGILIEASSRVVSTGKAFWVLFGMEKIELHGCHLKMDLDAKAM